MLSPNKSLRYQISVFFIFSTFVILSVLALFVTIYHYSALKSELQARLMILADDVIEHKLYKATTQSLMMQPLGLLEPYHHTTMKSNFSELKVSLTSEQPAKHEGMLQVTRKLQTKNYLTIYASLQHLYDEIFNFSMNLLGLIFIMLILIGSSFLLYLRKMFSPINCLVNYCKVLGSEKSVLPVCSGSLEINTLKNAILSLVEKNQSLINKERDIFKEAAHELKSPIAILKTRLALYEQKNGYGKEQFIQESKNDIDLLTTRLREMLFVKSIEMDIESPKELLSLLDQCEELSKSFEPIVIKRGLEIKPNREDSFSIYTHKKAIQKVLLAIFENIFIHSKMNSVIEIVLHQENRSIVIVNEISDSSDEKLFSSQIGTEIIQRLASKLQYEYRVEADAKMFTTTIRFIDESSKALDISSNI